MYLKRVESIGFKSFAKKTIIDFEPGINGIVGPNGCGKSNITDAIRWVLGEQSTKNLRASGMTDVIFSGSESYKKQNMAQVTLVFDNTKQQIKSEYTEIEITRRLYRNGESEYLLNKTACRLKDIVELIMDTGLGKDSLSMISQGAISNFAQAKPEDRRGIFEEAAGVSKYKKRKLETMRKLDKTNENLVRVYDILNELELQVKPLERQAKKARIFLEKQEILQNIEVNVIVSENKFLSESLEKMNSEEEDLKQELFFSELKLNSEEDKEKVLKDNIKEIDDEVSNLQNDLINTVNKISALEKQKSEDTNRINDMENTYDEKQALLLKNKLNDLQVELDNVNNNFNEMNLEYTKLKEEYEVRKTNYQNLKDEISRKQNSLQSFITKRDVLVNISENKSNMFAGVKAILDAKNSLFGIVGIVSDLFEVEEQYQEAISKSLLSSMQNIVVEDESAAKNAINFLKKNKAGRATFMPLDIIKERSIKEDDLFLAQKTEGFIDVASNLLQCDESNIAVFNHLLGNTLITNDLTSAIELSKRLHQKYRVVSLDGEIISVGGLVTGGKSSSDRNNHLMMKKDLEKANDLIIQLEEDINEKKESVLVFEQENDRLRNNINIKQMDLVKIEEQISSKSSHFESLKSEYNLISKEEFKQEEIDKEYLLLLENLNNEQLKKDSILTQIKLKRESRLDISKELEEIETNIKGYRSSINDCKNKLNSLAINISQAQSNIKIILDRLANEYQLTIESANELEFDNIDLNTAKKQVNEIKEDIRKLGYVNVLAIEEFEKANERYTFLSEQKNDLELACNELLETIQSTDQIMIDKFSKTIDDINIQLPITFKKLFGGGDARLEYSDPTNILETGIEIIAHPPGKSIQNLNLFSGGEKALIALSVLFAILKVRPVPLCILDEVEAALDQANVERFARYLKEYSENTQFIVITHRPGTMEECDLLYGVTMQEKGITRMIGVHIETAIDLVKGEA